MSLNLHMDSVSIIDEINFELMYKDNIINMFPGKNMFCQMLSEMATT